MQCANHEENLNLFLDGQLPAEAQIGLFKHLAQCSDCRDFLEKANRFRRLARSETVAFPEKIDRLLYEEILRRGKAASEPKPARSAPPAWRQRVAVPRFAVAAVIALLLLLGGMEIQNRLNPPPAIPVYQMMMPNANPVGVIYIIAQPVPFEPPTPVSPEALPKKGVPHESQNPAVAAFISLWSAVLERDDYCAG